MPKTSPAAKQKQKYNTSQRNMTFPLSTSNVVSSLSGVLKEDQEGNELVFDFGPKFNKEYIAAAPITKNTPSRPTFQRAMRLTVLIGQCFGLNPVSGIFENDTGKLRFKFYSGRCIYTFFSILGQLTLAFLCFLKLLQESKTTLSSSSATIFIGSTSVTTLLFLRIAMKWPQLSQYIAKLEAVNPNNDKNLVRRCNISCIVVLTLAALEHALWAVSAISVAINCQPDTNLYEAFIMQSVPWVWTYLTYNPFLGSLTQIFTIQCTVNWNFADTFVICISWYLTARLNQINQRIVDVRGKCTSMSFWRTIREDYCKATNLVRKIDDVINGVVFISFATNVFFICVQFLHNIVEEGDQDSFLCSTSLDKRPQRSSEKIVYHLYSFAFLVARSLAVSLIAAKVHTASKLPAQLLYDVPSSSYCVEVQRLIDQVHGDTVALSGLQFFNVKRGLVLTIAGTIVTYELVLMQFTGVTPTAAPPSAG